MSEAQSASKSQRSHLLFVFSQPMEGSEARFLDWYLGHYAAGVRAQPNVLSCRLYERHAIDVTRGRWPPPPSRYLGLVEASVDGAQALDPLIVSIEDAHRAGDAAGAPACWIYYPASEKVGRIDGVPKDFITVAFANGVAGRLAEFREFYATRHIRHALQLPTMANGQCFQRSVFQRPGSMAADFDTIAIYEMADTVEALMADFTRIVPGSLAFPDLDLEPGRFGEAAYALIEEPRDRSAGQLSNTAPWPK